jgi:hypothetical protein
MSRPLLALASILAALTAACSSTSGNHAAGDGGSGGEDAGADVCEPYVSTADLTTPTVSFGSDILPIVQPSCAIAGSTCHGTTSSEQEGLYLGNYDGGTDASFVLQGLVGVTSVEDPQMVIVKAGDPSNSYMMHKLDGDQCTQAAACNAVPHNQYPNCGDQMPYSSPALDVSTRDTIRRWIAQGAKNN